MLLFTILAITIIVCQGVEFNTNSSFVFDKDYKRNSSFHAKENNYEIKAAQLSSTVAYIDVQKRKQRNMSQNVGTSGKQADPLVGNRGFKTIT